MKRIKYVIYKEGKYFVAQCLNVDVSSFGKNIEEAHDNLQEALQLFFEDDRENWNYQPISEALLGETQICIK
jgi:predicted RNase H-like HicB family nuclease